MHAIVKDSVVQQILPDARTALGLVIQKKKNEEEDSSNYKVCPVSIGNPEYFVTSAGRIFQLISSTCGCILSYELNEDFSFVGHKVSVERACTAHAFDVDDDD